MESEAEVDVGSVANKGNFTEGSEPERLISRFLNYGSNTDSVAMKRVSSHSQALSRAILQACLPIIRDMARAPLLSYDGSYGLVGSMAIDHDVQAKPVNPNIVRQSSSPAGLFSHISIPNGIVLALITLLIGML
jgi:hypothetical protein